MKVVEVTSIDTLDLFLCLFCTENIPRSTYQQEGIIRNLKETHASEVHLIINSNDLKDFAHALHYDDAKDITINACACSV